MSEKDKTKPAEMSFSDWKKMKSALNSSTEEQKLPKIMEPVNFKSKKQNTQKAHKKDNRTGQDERSTSMDYRDQQRILYFEYLKQKQLMNQMFVMQVFNNGQRNVFHGPYNNNCRGFFNANNGQQLYENKNNAPLFNNLAPFNKNMQQMRFMHSYNNRAFTDNFLDKNDSSFGMSRAPISQQPFKQTNNLPSHMSLRTQKRTINANVNENGKKSNITKSSETIGANGSMKQEAPTSSTATASLSLKPKHKRPPMPPPPIAALPPEAQEVKQIMWREYRQNIKPFKNKDFLNAKRVIQRLKKKPYEELDEKEKERWEKANEFVNSHKKMLSDKAQALGGAASSRAALVLNALNYKNKSNLLLTPPAIQSPDDLTNKSACNFYAAAAKKDTKTNSQINNEENAQSSSKGTDSDSYELWSSFIPGGVLFKGS